MKIVGILLIATPFAVVIGLGAAMLGFMPMLGIIGVTVLGVAMVAGGLTMINPPPH